MDVPVCLQRSLRPEMKADNMSPTKSSAIGQMHKSSRVCGTAPAVSSREDGLRQLPGCTLCTFDGDMSTGLDWSPLSVPRAYHALLELEKEEKTPLSSL